MVNGRDWNVEPESIEPADCNGLKEDGDKEGEAGRIVLQQVEDVEPALGGREWYDMQYMMAPQTEEYSKIGF